MSMKYPGTRWFCGREELKRLRGTTLKTFFKMSKEYGIESFKYNAQDHFILFDNGSTIELVELARKPSDPLYERLGSSEYTGGWIEEAGEVPFGAFDVLKARIGRHLYDKYGISDRMRLTCNPSQNWLYETFYLPDKEGSLPDSYQFIQSLYTQNPFRESGSDSRLSNIVDETQRERLKHGNWEFSDDPDALITYEELVSCRDVDKQEGKKYCGVDVARLGDDSTVFAVRVGNCLNNISVYNKFSTTDVAEKAKTEAVSNVCSDENVGIDTVGIGRGVYDY